MVKGSLVELGEPVVLRPADEVTTEKKQLTKQPRVVVTGVGVVTPIGDDADVFYNNLLEGVSGISEIEAFDCAQFPTKIAGDIKSFSPDGWVTPKISKRADKFTLYLLTAGKKALADAGITEEVLGKLDKRRCGVIVGSALGGMGDVMLCGGSDAAVLPIGLGGFVACGALSKRNGEPTKASRPWDIVLHPTSIFFMVTILLFILQNQFHDPRLQM
nr:3-oxoacyl-[acyl-carrier-protein] synthase ii, chloroplastic [Quercus suber]